MGAHRCFPCLFCFPSHSSTPASLCPWPVVPAGWGISWHRGISGTGQCSVLPRHFPCGVAAACAFSIFCVLLPAPAPPHRDVQLWSYGQPKNRSKAVPKENPCPGFPSCQEGTNKQEQCHPFSPAGEAPSNVYFPSFTLATTASNTDCIHLEKHQNHLFL